MSWKSGSRFSEKDMRQNKNLEHIPIRLNRDVLWNCPHLPRRARTPGRHAVGWHGVDRTGLAPVAARNSRRALTNHDNLSFSLAGFWRRWGHALADCGARRAFGRHATGCGLAGSSAKRAAHAISETEHGISKYALSHTVITKWSISASSQKTTMTTSAGAMWVPHGGFWSRSNDDRAKIVRRYSECSAGRRHDDACSGSELEPLQWVH